MGIDLDAAALEPALGGLGSAVSTFAADVTRAEQFTPRTRPGSAQGAYA